MIRLETNYPILHWLVKLLPEYYRMLAVILTVQLGYAFLVSLQPFYFQRIVSLAIKEKGQLLSEGLPVVALLAAIYLAGTVLQGLGGYISCQFSSNLMRQLQTDYFERISRMPLFFFQRQSTGEFFTRFNNDLGHTQGFICNLLPSALREFTVAIIVTAILFYYCPAKLTFAALTIVVVTSLLVLLLNRIMSRYAKAQRAGWSEINRIFNETVEGIDTLKTFASENQRTNLFQKHTTAFRNLSVRAGSIAAVFSSGIDLISKICSLLLIFFAYHMISSGNITLEPFLLFFFYAGLLQASLSSLTGVFSNIQPQLVGIRNISSLYSESPEDDDPDMISERLDRPVSIEINGIRYSYPGGRNLYNDANLIIPAKSITVIHGQSGSGKSTLINLLLRFNEPQKGTVRLGGTDIKKISRKELRRTIGVVAQCHYLFNDTLRNNLLVAKPDASDDEIFEAIEQARLKEFVLRLPNGIDEILDPRGKGISEGEKQRISIARLFLKKSPIMVLDEPWSNLDVDARETLAEVLNRCKATTTILILTHEDLPYLKVDRIYRLRQEEGVFVREELVAELTLDDKIN